ncbi:dual CXXC motif small (seleno)protein [Humidesulfovibrio sp.]
MKLRCSVCGATHRIQDFAGQMGDDFEEELGFVSMDRL